MLDRLITNLPRGIFVLLAIGVGVFFIIILNPPYSYCNAEIETFKNKQNSFLYYSKSKFKVEPASEVLKTLCLRSNSAGGCFEYFSKLKIMVSDLDSVSNQCRKEVGQIKELNKTFWTALDLIVKIAWTDKPPQGAWEKKSWLTYFDLNLFCNYKRLSVDFYGSDRWSSFQEKMMSSLPGIEDLTREKVWELSILSEKCSHYL